MRRPLPALAAVAAGALLAATALGGCSADEPDSAILPVSSVPGTVESGFTVTGLDLFGPVASPPEAVEAARAGALAALDGYLQRAVLQALSRPPAGDLGPVFTTAAAGRVASGPDREALVDENLPKLTGAPRVDTATARLAVLAGSDGVPAVVNAAVEVKVVGDTDGGQVVVGRHGDVGLTVESGTWRIDSYDLVVGRTTPEGSSSTTVTSAPA